MLSFAREQLGDDLSDRDARGEFSRELWQKCADEGVQGMAVPQAYGGREFASILTAMLGMEALGRGSHDLGLLLGLNTQMWTVQLPILEFGTEEQKQRFLPRLCAGEWIGCEAMTEPEAGSDVFAMTTTAAKTDGGYVLNGEKCMITLAPIADVVLVVATVDATKGRWGLTSFLVEKGSDGFVAEPATEKMGLRTVPFGTLRFENCFVPDANRLGKEGAGFALTQHALEYERCCILASQLGAMERQLEATVAFAKNRKQFGQSIGKFQSVSNRVADMKVRLETARLLNYKVAWMKDQGKSAALEAAMLKLHLSESFVDSSMDALRIHGGRGYQTEFGVERDLRGAIGGLLYAGTSDIQRNIIAGLLGL